MPEGSQITSRFLRTPGAGRFLRLSGRTLEKHRAFGTGPRYRKQVLSPAALAITFRVGTEPPRSGGRVRIPRQKAQTTYSARRPP